MPQAPWSGSGSATTVAASVDIRNPLSHALAASLVVRNTGATNALLVSLDGTNFDISMAAGESFSFGLVIMDRVVLKSGASTTTYSWVANGT